MLVCWPAAVHPKPKLAKGHQHNSRVLFAEPTLCTRSSSPKPRNPGHTSKLTSYLSHMGRNIRGLSEFVVSSPWPRRDPKSRRLRHWPAFPLDFYVPRLRLYVHDFAFHCFGYPCKCLNHQEYCSLGFFIYYNLVCFYLLVMSFLLLLRLCSAFFFIFRLDAPALP